MKLQKVKVNFESIKGRITDLKINITDALFERKFLNRFKGSILKKPSSVKLAIILFILMYVGMVNAYNLFYVPREGRVIKLSTGTTPQRYVRYFEKVDVLKPETPTSETIQASRDNQISKSQPEKPEIQTNDLRSKPDWESLEEKTQSKMELNTPDFNADNKIGEEQTKTRAPRSMLTTQNEEDKKIETQISPVSPSDVRKLAYKLELYSLKDGAVIELHISESYSEKFIIFVQSGDVYVNEGLASDKDLEIWITRSGFEELLRTDDVSSTAKRLENEGEISVKQYSSTWTLYRKGYKGLAENLGLT